MANDLPQSPEDDRELAAELAALPPPPISPAPAAPLAPRAPRAPFGAPGHGVRPLNGPPPAPGKPGATLREAVVIPTRELPAAWQGPTPVQQRQRERVVELRNELQALYTTAPAHVAKIQALVKTLQETDGGAAEAKREDLDLALAYDLAAELDVVLDKYAPKATTPPAE